MIIFYVVIFLWNSIIFFKHDTLFIFLNVFILLPNKVYYFFLAVILRSNFFLNAYHHRQASSRLRLKSGKSSFIFRSLTQFMTALQLSWASFCLQQFITFFSPLELRLTFFRIDILSLSVSPSKLSNSTLGVRLQMESACFGVIL